LVFAGFSNERNLPGVHGMKGLQHSQRKDHGAVYTLSRNPIRVVTLLSLAFCLIGALAAARTQAARSRRFMFMQYTDVNRIVEMSAGGQVLWEHPARSLAVMFEPLKNGNVIYAFGGKPTGVEEISRDHKVVWSYTADCEQVLGFERLPNVNILVWEQGPCRAVEVNPKGEVVHITPLTTNEKPAHRQVRSVHGLPNGHILACHEADATVREVDADGKVVWEYPGVENVFEAIRLKNGNTLIGSGTSKRVMEVNKAGKTVWEFGPSDAPELNMSWITSIQVLKNGNLVVANFLRGQEGKGAHAFEITREKKVVWTFSDHNAAKLVTCVKALGD